jgi:hypothetical protein
MPNETGPVSLPKHGYEHGSTTYGLLQEISKLIYHEYSESPKSIAHGLLAISIAIVHFADTAKEISDKWYWEGK